MAEQQKQQQDEVLEKKGKVVYLWREHLKQMFGLAEEIGKACKDENNPSEECKALQFQFEQTRGSLMCPKPYKDLYDCEVSNNPNCVDQEDKLLSCMLGHGSSYEEILRGLSNILAEDMNLNKACMNEAKNLYQCGVKSADPETECIKEANQLVICNYRQIDPPNTKLFEQCVKNLPKGQDTLELALAPGSSCYRHFKAAEYTYIDRNYKSWNSVLGNKITQDWLDLVDEFGEEDETKESS